LGQIHQTLVDIDTGAQISCVSEQWATDQQFPQNSECSSTIIKATGYCSPRTMNAAQRLSKLQVIPFQQEWPIIVTQHRQLCSTPPEATPEAT
jgi:hypothetical protein